MNSEPVVNINRQLKNRRGKAAMNNVTKIVQKRADLDQSRSCSSSACIVSWKPVPSIEGPDKAG